MISGHEKRLTPCTHDQNYITSPLTLVSGVQIKTMLEKELVSVDVKGPFNLTDVKNVPNW